MADRLLLPTEHFLVHGEPDRLARATMRILRRDLVGLEVLDDERRALVPDPHVTPRHRRVLEREGALHVGLHAGDAERVLAVARFRVADQPRHAVADVLVRQVGCVEPAAAIHQLDVGDADPVEGDRPAAGDADAERGPGGPLADGAHAKRAQGTYAVVVRIAVATDSSGSIAVITTIATRLTATAAISSTPSTSG